MANNSLLRSISLLAVAFLFCGCVTGYTLVSPTRVRVAHGAMAVSPTKAWNKSPPTPYDISQEENWTQNGPLLDSIGFIAALPDGAAIARQRPKDDRKVPVFRASMTPQDLVSMIESFYRIKAGAAVFETTSVVPTTFLGSPAVQLTYNYVGADEVKRRGRSVAAIVSRKLYLMSLDGAASHYFEAALPEFESLAISAQLL